MKSKSISASIIDDKCTNCGICFELCPTHSIFQGLDRYYIDSDTCCGSQVCIGVCPVSAITSLKALPKTPANIQKDGGKSGKPGGQPGKSQPKR